MIYNQWKSHWLTLAESKGRLLKKTSTNETYFINEVSAEIVVPEVHLTPAFVMQLRALIESIHPNLKGNVSITSAEKLLKI